MANRGKKMNLGEFLGDNAAAYIPAAALPTGPRPRDEFEDDRRGGGFGDRRGGGDRFGDREATRSDQSDQWRGDRGGGGGGDRFGDRGGGGDRFGGGDRRGGGGGGGYGGDRNDGDNWRGGGGGGGDRGGGPSRYDRPARDDFRSEERPASMRLNLARRSDAPGSPRGGGGGGFQGRSGGDDRGGGGSDDKFAGAFRSGGGSRFGGGGGDRGGGDRFGGGGGDRFGGGDRRGGGDARFDDRGGSDARFQSRFGGNDRRDDGGSSGLSNAFGSMRMNNDARQQQQQQPQQPANEELDKKARAQKLREERKKKAEDERLAAEAAKKAALDAKKAAEEEALHKAEGDRTIMADVLASGKTGDELVKIAKEIFATSGRPSGAVVVETVTKKAEAVAKGSANWIAPTQYGGLLKLALADAPVADQVKALYALQIFLNAHEFPKGVLEKCFMALYTLDILEDKAFFDYKYDVDNDAPGRMKAIVQTSNWLTWLETPEEASDEEDDE